MRFARNMRQVWDGLRRNIDLATGRLHLAHHSYPESGLAAGEEAPSPPFDVWDPSHPPADRLYAELQTSWSTLAQLLDRLFDTSSSLGHAPRPSGSLPNVRDQYEAETYGLLIQPASQFLYSQPVRRALEALQNCDRELVRASRSRVSLDSRFLRVLSRAAADLCEPWRIRRRGAGPNSARRDGDARDEWQRWNRRCAYNRRAAAALLERYARWARKAKEDTEPTGDQPASSQQARERIEKRYALWRRQDAAVNALLEMELSFRDLGLTWLAAAEEFSGSAQRERQEILREARQTLEWVQEGLESGVKAPEQALQLASPEKRLNVWSRRMESESAVRLPEHIELGAPGAYPRWRAMPVRDVFLKTFTTYAQPPVGRIVEDYWSQSAEIMREVARAREVVDYWRDSPQASSGEDNLAEARHNAAAMLTEQMHTPLATEDLEARLENVFWTWNEEGASYIEAKQFGWVNLLQQPSGRRFIRGVAFRSGQERIQGLARRTGRWTSDRMDGVLEYVGGKVPSQPTAPPVVRRTTLRDTLALPASKTTHLPAIYRLLFRLAPVEDRRFLVGRDEELAGLAQAVADWDEGRFAACLVVGARGSGKTSLLNCAAKEVFASHTLVRGQFEQRALNRQEIDAFLRELLHLEPGADLKIAFAAERRIIVIEEAERIYLRKVGGFAGAHYLIGLMHCTAPTTLWIIAMNDKALRVLDAGAHIRQLFSHRINAMSLSRGNLEKAILERHRLSGLRLEFAPPPSEDPRVSRVKRFLGLEDSAQKLFFDSLYQQSEGVLRSAFELWVSSIDRVEGETLKIRQPLDPAFNAFRSELAQADQFTLLAIQEHGSLTQDELSEVLCESGAVSRRRFDHLSALGLVEPDPEHPGLRVRPEAQRFTNDLLRRANLT